MGSSTGPGLDFLLYTWGFTSLGGSSLYLEGRKPQLQSDPSGLKELPIRGADAWTESLISFTNRAISVLVALLSVLLPRL